MDSDLVFNGNLTKNSTGGRHFEAKRGDSVGSVTLAFDVSEDGAKLSGTIVMSAELFGMGVTTTYSLECAR